MGLRWPIRAGCDLPGAAGPSLPAPHAADSGRRIRSLMEAPGANLPPAAASIDAALTLG
jgi:hypothetical protein